MIETIGHLKQTGMRGPVCIAVHGILAGTAFRDLIAAGAAKVVTANTVPHETNCVDIPRILAQGANEMRKP